MLRSLLKSKIHKATVTEANKKYIGSITIDETLMRKVDFWPGERVLVTSNTNGARLETYVIKGKAGSGIICMNGAAAHLIKKGHEVIIMAFGQDSRPLKPKVILVDRKNRFLRYLSK